MTTYHLRLKESPNNPAADIVVARQTPPSDDPLTRVTWKVHAQYDNGTARQVSSSFTTTEAESGIWDVIAHALHEAAQRF